MRAQQRGRAGSEDGSRDARRERERRRAAEGAREREDVLALRQRLVVADVVDARRNRERRHHRGRRVVDVNRRDVAPGIAEDREEAPAGEADRIAGRRSVRRIEEREAQHDAGATGGGEARRLALGVARGRERPRGVDRPRLVDPAVRLIGIQERDGLLHVDAHASREGGVHQHRGALGA